MKKNICKGSSFIYKNEVLTNEINLSKKDNI